MTLTERFQRDEAIEAQEDHGLDFGPGIMFTGCNTSQQGCSGVAYFENVQAQIYSFRVWFRNGGYSNFVLQPRGTQGSTHGIHVQSGDQYSYEAGNNGVPNNARRYWINVG